MLQYRARSELIKAFKSAGLYKRYKKLNGKDGVIYPEIHAVSFNKEKKYLRYTFSILNGTDPAEVRKKAYCFQQHFGRNVELEGDLKNFTLTVHGKAMPAELLYKEKEVIEAVANYKLGIICGMDRYGQYVALDLLKQPHILIAGETGSGKSTQLRSILTTLIRTKKPAELQLFLADCKKSEFHLFRKVEHVQCVLSKPSDIAAMLQRIKKELDERSDLTEKYEVGHIDEVPESQRRPYIVVCIDEFVMLRKDEAVMDILTEIVAIGRTLGVFAILSMQRPNAEVLDTTIRANLTVSMGFKLRDGTESKMVNTPGSEKLEVSGRFIMNSAKLYELQAPYLTMPEAKRLLKPFIVSKPKPVQPPELTEKDVFNDVFN